MNDRDARERRYLRLLENGFSETEARQMVETRKRTNRTRKRLPLERACDVNITGRKTGRKIVGIWE
jgi:hypothetical protein